MADGMTLPSATDLARRAGVTWPNETPEYRAARTALLAQEIELRRMIESVAAQRRALPPGGEVTGDYRFEGENGPVSFEGLFGDKDTLGIYSFMYGPQREGPCPMCTSLVDSWDGDVPHAQQKMALAFVIRSPVTRFQALKAERGWRNVPVFSDLNQNFSRDYHAIAPDGSDIPGFSVFTKRDGVIRHFWSGEMSGATADPGQDPRGAPDFASLWTILDCTPGGRGGDWYPKNSD